MKIAIIGAFPSSIVNFRGELTKELSRDNDVIALASNANEEEINSIENLGAKYVNYKVERNGLNPFIDIITFFQLLFIYSKEQPGKVIAYTIKPIVWGGVQLDFQKKSPFMRWLRDLVTLFKKGERRKEF